jgi:hypothetical protein
MSGKHYLLNEREHATVIAALRCFEQVSEQCGGDLTEDLADLATVGGKFEAMDLDEIDDLCVRLNTGGTDKFVRAVHLLVDAYIKGKLNDDHTSWSDIDAAEREARHAIGGKELARKRREWRKALK